MIISSLQNMLLNMTDVFLNFTENLKMILSNGISPRECFYLGFTDSEIKNAIESDTSFSYNMNNYTVDETLSYVDGELLHWFEITEKELHQIKIKNQQFFINLEFQYESLREITRIRENITTESELDNSEEEIINKIMNENEKYIKRLIEENK